MPFTGWESLINSGQYSQLNSGSALSNSNTLTDVSAGANQAGQAFLLPANYLYPGLQLAVRAAGIASSSGSPNLTLGLYWGGVAGTALAASTFSASANMSNAVWRIEADVRVDAVGSSASLRTLGVVRGVSSSAVSLPVTASGGNAISVASGASAILTLGAQWGTAAAGNSITCYQFLVEQLN